MAMIHRAEGNLDRAIGRAEHRGRTSGLVPLAAPVAVGRRRDRLGMVLDAEMARRPAQS